MEGFWFPMWDVIKGWSGLGQGIFLCVLFGAFFTLVQNVFFYIGVAIHGWPPPDTPIPKDEA